MLGSHAIKTRLPVKVKFRIYEGVNDRRPEGAWNVSGGHQGLMRCRRPGGHQEIGERPKPTGGRRRDLPVVEGAFGARGGGMAQLPPPPIKYAPGWNTPFNKKIDAL